MPFKMDKIAQIFSQIIDGLLCEKSLFFCRQRNSRCCLVAKKILLCHLHKENQTLHLLQQSVGKLVTD